MARLWDSASHGWTHILLAMPEYFGLYTNPRSETPSVGDSVSYGPVDLHRSETPRPELSISIITCVCSILVMCYLINSSITSRLLLWCSCKYIKLLWEVMGLNLALVIFRITLSKILHALHFSSYLVCNISISSTMCLSLRLCVSSTTLLIVCSYMFLCLSLFWVSCSKSRVCLCILMCLWYHMSLRHPFPIPISVTFRHSSLCFYVSDGFVVCNHICSSLYVCGCLCFSCFCMLVSMQVCSPFLLLFLPCLLHSHVPILYVVCHASMSSLSYVFCIALTPAYFVVCTDIYLSGFYLYLLSLLIFLSSLHLCLGFLLVSSCSTCLSGSLWLYRFVFGLGFSVLDGFSPSSASIVCLS